MQLKKWGIYTFAFLVLAYLLYSHFVLTPQKLTHFSLIDDGQTYQNSLSFNRCFFNWKCSDLENVLVERQFGRFRPVYWIAQYLKVQIFDANPLAHHLFRVYGEGIFLVLLLFLSARQMGTKFWGILVSFLVFVGSYSFSENILRLGPVEPTQIVFVCMFSIIYLSKSIEINKKYYFAFVMFVLAILSKETSIILVGPPLLIEYFYYLKNKKQKPKFGLALLAIGILITIFGRIMSKPSDNELFYSSNFSFNIGRIFSESISYFNIFLNNVTPLFKVSLLIFVILYLQDRKKIISKEFSYWIILTITSFVILLPWKYVLERYLLLTIFAAALIIGNLYSLSVVAIFNTWKKLRSNKFKYIFSNLAILFIISNVYFKNYPINLARTINYSNWYSIYLQYEADQIKAIASIMNDTVYINGIDNLNNWEVLYEIPIHLKYFYTSGVSIKLLPETLPESGYIFTRQPFDLSTDLKSLDKYELISSKKYIVTQIDPIKFKDDFQLKPLSIFRNLPYKQDYFKYYWEIRKI